MHDRVLASHRRLNSTVRLPLALRSNIETWAKQQEDRPSRSEAIRRLIEIALTVNTKKHTGKK
jgi:hypothetical protein